VTEYKKKLIEVALPLAAISDASAAEKSVRNGHPANLHQWWARRPLAACRAVLFASLVDDPSSDVERFPTSDDQERERKRLFDLMAELVQWDSSNSSRVLDAARQEIARSCPQLPSVLDPFGGGGAIPIETLRLGLESHTGDLNPVAVLIQRFMLQFLPRFRWVAPVSARGQSRMEVETGPMAVAADVRHYGNLLRELAVEKVGLLYPACELPDGSLATPLAWIWARTIQSPDPSWAGHVPLVKSWILSKKPGRPIIHIVPEVDVVAQQISYRVQTGGTPATPTVSRGHGVCLATGSPIDSELIKEQGRQGLLGRDLLAIVGEGSRRRTFATASREQEQVASSAKPAWVPSGAMSDHPQYMGTPRYGLDEWGKLFTSRQLCALTTLVDLLPEVRDRIQADAELAGMDSDLRSLSEGGRGARAYSDGVALALAFAVDKLADLNNSLVRWEPVAECPRNLFGRQAIQMTWDYAEANPFSSSSGSLATVLDGIARTIEGQGFAFPSDTEADVRQRDARNRVAEFDGYMVCTDPPYYASVPYSDISDFFYVWLRKSAQELFPNETATLVTPKSDELVADIKRHGSLEAADQFFEEGMTEVFTSIARNHHPDFPATIFYAIKATESSGDASAPSGWAAFLGALIASGLVITATWPIRTENRSRLRAIKSNALASSIVLVCRPRPTESISISRREFVSALDSELPPALRVLQLENIAPVDLAQAAVGPGMAVFSRNARVIEADGTTMSVTTALTLINQVVADFLTGEDVELDADTRVAITWFEQHEYGSGLYGDAATLARAKDTSVEGLVYSGIATARDGRLSLSRRSELADDWDPATDDRLTVWETTQYLIRALESSESDAAQLLRRIGEGMGERSRQLAYLLYGICDRNRWAEEASAYNMLVTAWPEISRLAAGPTSGTADESRLF